MMPFCYRRRNNSVRFSRQSNRWASRSIVIVVLASAIAIWLGASPAPAQSVTNAAASSSYEILIAEGNQLLKDGKLKEAYADALAAARKEENRFKANPLDRKS